MKGLDVVVVAYRSEAWLPRLVEDLQAMTRTPFQLHLFDNTGNPKTLSRAWNDLASKGSSDFIAILNPDIALSPGWDERLIQSIENDPMTGIAVPDPVGSSPTDDPQPSRERMAELASSLEGLIKPSEYNGPLYAFCLRRSTWELMRGVDERLRFFIQDTDLIHRVREHLGLRTVQIPSCPVWHHGSASIKEAKARGEIDLGLENARSVETWSALRAGRLQLWHRLTSAERRSVCSNPLYARMGT